jgi:hypothetical protein
VIASTELGAAGAAGAAGVAASEGNLWAVVALTVLAAAATAATAITDAEADASAASNTVRFSSVNDALSDAPAAMIKADRIADCCSCGKVDPIDSVNETPGAETDAVPALSAAARCCCC